MHGRPQSPKDFGRHRRVEEERRVVNLRTHEGDVLAIEGLTEGHDVDGAEESAPVTVQIFWTGERPKGYRGCNFSTVGV